MSGEIAKLFVEVGGDTSQAVNQLNQLNNSLNNLSRGAATAGVGLTGGLTVPLLGIGGAALTASAQFESSFAGIKKTVDSGQQSIDEFAIATGKNITTAKDLFAELESQMRGMAMVKPVDVNTLNSIGEAAGQLGIATKDIPAFTSVVADMAATTDMSADMASTMMAKFANITGMAKEASPAWDRMGSAIVDLGNRSASTEQEIMKMSVRLAGAGTTIGMTEQQILAFSSALASVGIRAEAGGSSMSTALIKMSAAVEEGGAKLDTFAQVAGMTADQFAYAFKDNAALAMESFVNGLKRVDDASDGVFKQVQGLVDSGVDVSAAFDQVGEAGESVFAILKELGLGDIRVRNAMLALANSNGILSDSLKWSEDAWNLNAGGIAGNNAMLTEAKVRYQTLESQVTLFRNKLYDVAITLGNALKPALTDVMAAGNGLLGVVGQAVKWFAQLPEPVRTAVAAFAGVLAVSGPVVVTLSVLAGTLGVLLSPLGLVIIALATLAAAFVSNFGNIQGVLAPFGAFVQSLFNVAVQSINNFKAGADPLTAVLAAIATSSSTVQAVFGVLFPLVGMGVTAFQSFTAGAQLAIAPLAGLTMAAQLLAPAMQAAIGAVAAIFSGLPAIISVAMQAAQAIIAAAAPVMFSALASGIPVVVSIFNQIPPIVSAAMSAITGIATVIATLLVGAVQVAAPLVQGLFTGMMAVVAAVIPPLSQLAQVILSGIGASMQAIQPIVAGVFAAFQQAATTIGPLLTQLGQTIGVYLAGAINILITAAQGMFNSFIQGAQVAGPMIVQIASFVGTLLVGAFLAIAPAVATAFSYLPQIVSTAVTVISNLVNIVGGVLIGALSEASGAIQVMESNWGGVQSVLATVGAIFMWLANTIGQSIITAILTLGSVVGWLLEHLGGILPIVAAVGAGFAAFSIITTVVGWVTGLVTAIGALLPVFEGLWIVITSGGGIMASLVGLLTAPIIVIPLVIAAVAGLAAAWATNFGNIRDKTEYAVGQVKLLIDQMGGYLGALGAAATKFAVNDYAGAWNALVSGVQSANSKAETEMARLTTNFHLATDSVVGSVTAASAGVDAGYTDMENSATAHSGAIVAATGDGFSTVQAQIVALMTDTSIKHDSAWSKMLQDALQKLAGIKQAAAEAKNAFSGMEVHGTGIGMDFESVQTTENQVAKIQALAKRAADNAAKAGATYGSAPVNFQKAAADTAGKAGSAGTQSVEDKMTKAAEAITKVSDLVVKLSDMIKDGLDKMTVGDGADKILQVAANLANMGRQISDVFAQAAVGLKEDTDKAAQALGEGISAAASALNAVVGLLPKLWEFIQSDAWGEMQGSLGMMLGVASQMINWGRSLYDVMAAASAGVTEESAKAAQALAQGIAASAQAVQSVIGLLPKLWEFVNSPEFDQIMASLPMLTQVAGKLIEWGKVLFDIFSAAANGVSQESAAAAQALAQGIGSAAQAITAVIDLIPKLLDFSKWEEGMSVLHGEGRDALMKIVAQLSELGRMIFDVFASAGMDIKTKALAAAANLASGIKSAGEGLTTLMTLLPALLNFAGWDTGFKILNDSATRGLIVYVAQRLAGLGALILQAWGEAAVDFSTYTMQGVNALRDGVKAAGEGLTTLMALLPQLLNFNSLDSQWRILTDDALRALIVFIAQQLMSLGKTIFLQFVAASNSLSSYAVAGATNLTNGVKSAGDALTTVMGLIPKLLDFASLDATWQALALDSVQANIIFIAGQLGELAQRIYRAFYLGAQQVNQNIPVAALVLTDAIKSAADAMETLFKIGPELLAFVSNEQGWRIATDDSVQANIVYIAGRLGELAQRIYRAFYLGAQQVNQNIPVAAMALTDALKSASDAMETLFKLGPDMLAFVSNEQGWRIVTDGKVQAHLVYIAGQLGELAARIYRAFYLGAQQINQNIPVAAMALADAIKSASDALLAVMTLAPEIVKFVSAETGWRIATDQSVQDHIVYIAGRLSELAQRIASAFSAAAHALTQSAVDGSKLLADGIKAALDGLKAVMELLPALAKYAETPVTFTDSLVSLATQLAADAARLAGIWATAAKGFDQLTNDGVEALSSAIGSAADGFKATIELLKTLFEFAKAPIVFTSQMRDLAVTLAGNARDLAKIWADAAKGFDKIANDGVEPMSNVIKAALDGFKAIADLLKTLFEWTKAPIELTDKMRLYAVRLAANAHDLAKIWADAAKGFDKITNDGVSPMADAVGSALSGIKDVIDILKVLSGFSAEPVKLTFDMAVYAQSLFAFARWTAERWAEAAIGFDRITNDGIAPMADAVGSALSGLKDIIDILKALSSFAAEPVKLTFDMAIYAKSLFAFARWTAERWAEAALGFNLLANDGIAPMADAVGSALSGLKDIIDILKALSSYAAEPVKLTLDMAIYAQSLFAFARWTAERWAEAAKGFDMLSNDGIALMADAVGSALSGLKDVIDILKALSAFAAEPVKLTFDMAIYAQSLFAFARWTAERWAAAAKGFDLLSNDGIAPLSDAVGAALSGIKDVIDILKALSGYAAEPVKLTLDMAIYAQSMFAFARWAAERWAAVAKGFDLISNDGIAPLSDAVGSSLSGLKDVIDILKALSAYAAEPVKLTLDMANYAQSLFAFARWVAARFAAAAVGFQSVSNDGIAPMADAIKGALDTMKSTIDILKVLAGYVEAPIRLTLDMAIIAQSLIAFAKWVATKFAEAAAGFENINTAGVDPLSKAAGAAFGAIKDALETLPKLASFLGGYTGLTDAMKSQFKLLVTDMVSMFTTFAQIATDAHISDVAVTAAENLNKGFGSAMGALKNAFDMIKTITENGLPRLSFNMVNPQSLDQMLKPYFDFIDNVYAAFAAHAEGMDTTQVATVTAFAGSVGTLFDTLKKVFDAITAFSGMNFSSSNTGIPTGVSNISSILNTVFTTFESYAPRTAAVTSVATALVTAVNAMQATASLLQSLSNTTIDPTKLQNLIDAIKVILSPETLHIGAAGQVLGASLGDAIVVGLWSKADAIRQAIHDIANNVPQADPFNGNTPTKPALPGTPGKPSKAEATSSGTGNTTVYNYYNLTINTTSSEASNMEQNFNKMKALKGAGGL